MHFFSKLGSPFGGQKTIKNVNGVRFELMILLYVTKSAFNHRINCVFSRAKSAEMRSRSGDCAPCVDDGNGSSNDSVYAHWHFRFRRS